MEAAQEAPDRPPLDVNALSDEAFLSANGIPRLTVVASTGSTNADLLRGATEDPMFASPGHRCRSDIL